GDGEGDLDGGVDAEASKSSAPGVWRRRRERRIGALLPNVIHYASVMAPFAEHPGGWKTNLALMKEMEDAGIAPNVYAYNAAIAACGHEGRWAEAVAVFRRMDKKGVAPDEVSFLNAIEACGKGDQWALAVALLREMSAVRTDASTAGTDAADGATGAENGGPATGTVNPTVEAYTAAITACGNAGQWEAAVGLLREVTEGDVMVLKHPRAGDVGGATSDDEEAAEAKEGEGSQAAGQEEESSSSSSASPPSPPPTQPVPVPLAPDVVLYNAAIEACGKSGQWERALQLLAEVWEAGLSPTVAHQQRPQQLPRLLLPLQVTYNSAIACCGTADKWEKAVALLDEMRQVGLSPVSSTFLPAIEACSRAGEGKLAYVLIKE
ncbi:unnamed protein product, partial [Scytosiphon promiscuus]